MVALLPVLAGCIGSAPQDVAPQSIAAPQELDVVLDIFPSGVEAHAEVVELSAKYPGRTGDDSPGKLGAREFLQEKLKEADVDVQLHEYTIAMMRRGQLRDLSGANVLGIIPGATDRWIVISAHYDSVCNLRADALRDQSVCDSPGALDDGSGTVAVLELARAAATRDWNHGLIFALWDDEEEGLVGSRAFVLELVGSEYDVAANFQLDMVGMNWPCEDPGLGPLPLEIMHGIPRGVQPALVDAVAAAAAETGAPEGAISIREGENVWNYPRALGGGGSDHANFAHAGIAYLFFFVSAQHSDVATTPAGGVSTPWTYTFHNTLDTVEQMELRCGGEEKLQAGFQTTLDVAMGTLIRFDAVAS